MRRQHTTISPKRAQSRLVVDDSKAKVYDRRSVLSKLLHRVLRLWMVNNKWQVITINTVIFLSIVLVLFKTASSKQNAQLFGYHPRYIRFVVTDEGSDPNHSTRQYGLRFKVNRLDRNLELYPSKRLVYISRKDQARLMTVLDDSDEYMYGRADEFETEECKAQYEWQKASYPTCNTLHEIDILDVRDNDFNQTRILGNGYWRDVWLIHNIVVLKTLRYRHDFEDRNYDRHRRDALAMEHLTTSKMVVNIYGFCANSGLFQHADGGSIMDVIWPRSSNATIVTDLQRLQLAAQAAMGIAAMHNIDKEGVASIAHTDITPSQFVAVGGVFRLNDFNRARFIRWNTTADQPCPYFVGKNPGKNRSPEEYNSGPQNEMVDIYSFGNILYMLLTGLWPFVEDDEKEAREQVKRGMRPPIPQQQQELWNVTNFPIVNDLMEVMSKCHKQNPEDRPSALDVSNLLLASLQKHDPIAVQRWGLEEEVRALQRNRNV